MRVFIHFKIVVSQLLKRATPFTPTLYFAYRVPVSRPFTSNSLIRDLDSLRFLCPKYHEVIETQRRWLGLGEDTGGVRKSRWYLESWSEPSLVCLFCRSTSVAPSSIGDRDPGLNTYSDLLLGSSSSP